MARQIKNLSAFPEHSISMVLKKIGKTEEIRKVLLEVEKELKEVSKSETDHSKKHVITDQEIFDTKIKHQMLEELQKCGDRDYNLSFSLNLPENPMGLEVDQLIALHQRVKVDKQTTTILNLFLSYYQGLIYITLKRKCSTQEEYVKNLRDKFGVTYSTAQQYVVVTLLIKRYPKVLLVGLTHSQIRKHQKRLLLFMEENGNFEAPVVLIMGKKIHRIKPSTADFAGIKVKPSYDPDADLKPEIEGATSDSTLDIFQEEEDLEGLLGFDADFMDTE